MGGDKNKRDQVGGQRKLEGETTGSNYRNWGTFGDHIENLCSRNSLEVRRVTLTKASRNGEYRA